VKSIPQGQIASNPVLIGAPSPTCQALAVATLPKPPSRMGRKYLSPHLFLQYLPFFQKSPKVEMSRIKHCRWADYVSLMGSPSDGVSIQIRLVD